MDELTQLSDQILTVVTGVHLTHISPLEHNMGSGLDTGVALLHLPLLPHRPDVEPVHAVVVQLLVLVQEGVVHGQLLLVIIESGDVGA